MPAKEIKYDVKAREKLLKVGVDTLANAVKVTLGPRGRNVVWEKILGIAQSDRSPRKSNWKTSSKTWAPRMVKEVASKTSDCRRRRSTPPRSLRNPFFTEGANW